MTEKPDSTNLPGEQGKRASRSKRLRAWFLRVWRRLLTWFPKAWQAIQPGPRILRGVTLGTLGMAVFWALFFAADLDIGFGLVPDFLLASLICLVATALFGLACALVVKIIQVLPRFLTLKGIMAIGGVVGAVHVARRLGGRRGEPECSLQDVRSILNCTGREYPCAAH